MHATFGPRFNEIFTTEMAARVRGAIEKVAGAPVSFRLSDRPVFLPETLWWQLQDAVRDFTLVVDGERFRRETLKYMPAHYRVTPQGGMLPRATFTMFDFALTRQPGGEIVPKLIECQGAPTFVGVLPAITKFWQDELWRSGLKATTIMDWSWQTQKLRRLLGHAVMVDVDPPTQTFRTDFAVLAKIHGTRILDLTEGDLAKIEPGERVLSRVVPIEAERAGRQAVLEQFYHGGHYWVLCPDWEFCLSKAVLPELAKASETVPETIPLTAESRARFDSTKHVLKLIDGFGGKDVNLHPTEGDVDSALASGSQFILQERLTLAPVVQPPDGPPLFCEVRVFTIGDEIAGMMCRLARDPKVNIGSNPYPWCGFAPVLLVNDCRTPGGPLKEGRPDAFSR